MKTIYISLLAITTCFGSDDKKTSDNDFFTISDRVENIPNVAPEYQSHHFYETLRNRQLYAQTKVEKARIFRTRFIVEKESDVK